MLKRYLTVIALLLLPSAQAVAQEWVRLADVNLTVESPANAAIRSLWAREIARNDRFFVEVARSPLEPGKSAPTFGLWTSIPVKGGELVVTVLLTAAGCETGSNDFRAESNVARCPAKTVFRPTGSREVIVLETLRACYVAVSPDDEDASEKMKRTGVFAILRDGKVELATAERGARIAECDVKLKGR